MGVPQLRQYGVRTRLSTREDLISPDQCRRIVVKVGSAVVTREDECGLALGRVAGIVEQLSELQLQGRQMMLVTSGAVAFGKQMLAQQNMLARSVRQTLRPSGLLNIDPRACSAAGQGGLISLYQSMFQQYGITCAQVLVTKNDFLSRQTMIHLGETLNELMRTNVVPIINENDAIAPPGTINADLEGVLSVTDNDSLAANVSRHLNADLLMILSDVDGIYNAPPSSPNAKLLDSFQPTEESTLVFGEGSKVGRGGMEAKVDAAAWAWGKGTAVVVANGMLPTTIVDVVSGKKVGTLFTDQASKDQGKSVAETANRVRKASRELALLTPEQRQKILLRLADMLLERNEAILAANQQDLDAARSSSLGASLLGRLALSDKKLEDLAAGLRQIAAESQDLLGKAVRRTEVSSNLLLEQVTVPLGVLMIIFESRPDCLIQIAGLSIASGNGLMLKGGKEALHSNRFLHSLVQEALAEVTNADAVTFLEGREEVSRMLEHKGAVDLIIPRGGNDLVAAITEQAQGVPVLGHADGVCHVYVDESADVDMAVRIVTESKVDYPSACNALETLLLHKSLVATPTFERLISALRGANVKINVGPRLSKLLPLSSDPVTDFHVEYGELECAVEVVDDVSGAVDHVNQHGSSHTDVVVASDDGVAQAFLNGVDSACVFHNASSRFADGYRFGLGAEVGISTGRIHARGPVGVDGLLTTKWKLTTTKPDGSIIADFVDGSDVYTHTKLPVQQ